MLPYRVKVRDYTHDIEYQRDGSVKSIRIQSPSLSLEGVRPPFIALPLQGNNQAIARLIPDVSTIRDDIHESSYEADAHGIIVQPGDCSIVHPVWTYQRGLCLQSPYSIEVVNLVNYQEATLSARDVCWVPHLESPEGITITLLDSLAKDGHAKCTKAVVVQTPGRPQETKLQYKEVARLREFAVVEEPRKNDIFNVHLRAVRRMLAPPGRPPAPSGVGSGPSDLSRLAHETLQRSRTLLMGSSYANRRPKDNANDYWELWSGCTSEDGVSPAPEEISDDETLEQLPSTECRKFCCNYPRLAPTLENLRPNHWHKQDDECPLGSAHPGHCVYAQAFPNDCVVDTPRHRCCPPLIPGSRDSTQSRVNSCTKTTRDLKLESPPQESKGPGTPRECAETGEPDIFDDLLLPDMGLEYPEAPVSDISYPECFSPAASWPEADTADHADDEGSPIPDLSEPEFMVFGDDRDGDGGDFVLLEAQAGAARNAWPPAVHLDALVSTPKPPDMVY